MKANRPTSYQKNRRKTNAGGPATGRLKASGRGPGSGRASFAGETRFGAREGRPTGAGPRSSAQSTASLAERTEAASEQVEGRHPVIEALKSGRALNKILIAEGVEGGSANEILGKARDLGVIVQRVPRAKIDTLATTHNHQGIIAYLAAKEYVELDDILEQVRQSPRPGLLVLLDEVEDPFNLGSILRSAEAAGAHGVVIPKRRAVPLTATVAKASAGAIEHMPVARVTNISQAIETIKQAGFWVVGTDVDAKELFYEADLTTPIALVIGSEGKGIGENVKKRCDVLVRLPMIGEIQSLNAGVATGVLLYEAVRQRGGKRE
ncbi:MAG: rRNA ((2251)-2-O)-methyltransferase RlmB [Bacilli bacterium]|nr:rRNA ((2251)-2-O)-methyltransferase RlmB [Bacilli bacterium]